MPVPIPDGGTWTGSETGREWTSHGTDMERSDFLWDGFGFHVYIDPYPWATPSWAEITGVLREMQSFSVKRSVAGWWRGTRQGGGTLTLYQDGDNIAANYQPSHRIRITVDVPSGEHDLFTGFIQSHKHIFDAKGVPMLQVQMVDGIGYTGMADAPLKTVGNQVTGFILRDYILQYGAGIISSDIAGISNSEGLTQNYTIAAGNLINKINQYLRGELGMLWVDPEGVWQFRERDWWYPQPDPVATIGSLERGEGGNRDDPALAEDGYLVTQSKATAVAEMAYNKVFLTGSGTGNTIENLSTARTGIRYWSDTVEITSLGDLRDNADFLAKVLNSSDSFDGPILDQTRTVTIPSDVSVDNMEYAAAAELTDFLEVAWETLPNYWREWHPAWVMGVTHRWNTSQGWSTELQLEGGLAQWDEPAEQ